MRMDLAAQGDEMRRELFGGGGGKARGAASAVIICQSVQREK